MLRPLKGGVNRDYNRDPNMKAFKSQFARFAGLQAFEPETLSPVPDQCPLGDPFRN